MSKTFTVMWRETRSLFGSWIFWSLAAGFLFFFGVIFTVYINPGTMGAPPEASMQPLMGLIGTIMLFVAPLLSMRLLAEEQRSGTLEILMTSPVQDWQVVLGKWLAAYTAYVAMIAGTLVHVALMWNLAQNGMATGPLISSYLGVLLLGAALIALGTFTSSLTENQVVAAFLGIMLVMLMWFLPLVGDAGDGPLFSALGYAGLSDHYQNFGQGVIDTRDLVYFVSITAGALYLTIRTLETRRWR